MSAVTTRPDARMTVTTGGAGRRRPRSNGKGSPLAVSLTMLFMIVMTVYFLLPLFWLVVASTKSTGDLFTTAGFWFADFNFFDNIARITEERGGVFWRWLLNSVIYAGGGALLTAIVCALTGYALAKFRFRGRRTLTAMILASVLVPNTVLVLPTYLLVANLNLLDTYWAVLLPSLVYPFGVFVSQMYADASIPNELLEAARIDGAGEVRTFFSVGLPVMVPGIVTVFLLSVVQIWNNFFLPLMMLNDNSLFPVTLGLVVWNQQAITDPQLQSLVVVGSLLSVIPLAIMFVTMQRYLRSGLAAGSVKL